jgi:hypothetical protein
MRFSDGEEERLDALAFAFEDTSGRFALIKSDVLILFVFRQQEEVLRAENSSRLIDDRRGLLLYKYSSTPQTAYNTGGRPMRGPKRLKTLQTRRAERNVAIKNEKSVERRRIARRRASLPTEKLKETVFLS